MTDKWESLNARSKIFYLMVYFVNTFPEDFSQIMNKYPMGMTIESGFNRELHGVWGMMVETTRF